MQIFGAYVVLLFQFWNSGKVTSLVAKKDVPLATRIEEAIKKNESLEALSVNTVRKAVPSSPSTRKITIKRSNSKITKGNTPTQKGKSASGAGTTAKKPKNVVIKKFNRASPKSTNSSSFKPPKDSKSASTRPSKDSKFESSRPPRDSKSANSRSPKDSKFESTRSPRDSKSANSRSPRDSKSAANSRSPRDSKSAANSRSPKDSKFESTRSPRDSKSANSRSPKDSKSGGKVEKFRTSFESRKYGGGKRGGAKLNVVGFRGRSSGKRVPMK
jgi:hypothetical protein